MQAQRWRSHSWRILREAMINPELLAILVCPACRGLLRHENSQQELVCQRCNLGYPIRDGIPILLVDEARRLG